MHYVEAEVREVVGNHVMHSSEETRQQIGLPSRFDQTREVARNAIADEYNGDRKILNAIRAYAFVVYEVLVAQGKDMDDSVWDQGQVILFLNAIVG